MMTMLEELKQTTAEMPWFVVAVLLSVVLCVGVNAEIVCGADGDRPRVAMGRVEASMEHMASICEREARRCVPVSVSVSAPGVTMLIGVRNYWVEMTLPEAAIEAKLDSVRSSLSGLQRGYGHAPRRMGSWHRA